MKKMNSPKLEVIHFNTEDVIVTSGNSVVSAYSSATELHDNFYFTIGSEVSQGTAMDEISRNKFYKFNIVDGVFTQTDRDAYPIRDIGGEIYAWYDEFISGWYTEGKSKNSYYSGTTYTWIYNNKTN